MENQTLHMYGQIEKSLLDYVIDANKGFDDFCAINFLGKRIRFSSFLKHVRKIEDVFRNAGVHSGDVISILYLTTPEVIYVMYALNHMQATVNFLNPMEPDSIREALEEEQPRYVLCYDEFYELLDGKIDESKVILMNPMDGFPAMIRLLGRIKNGKKGKGTLWKTFVRENKSAGLEDIPPQKEAYAYGVHLGTGGSSGIPKQVNLTNELLNNIVKQHVLMSQSTEFNFEYERGDVLLDVIPPHLGYGVCDIHLALSMGLTLAIEPNPEPKLFVSAIERYKPQFILAGPVLWKEYCQDTVPRNHSFIKTAVSGGEKLDRETEDSTNDRLARNAALVKVKEGVGMTEIAGVATFNSSVEDAGYTVGRPLPEYRIGIFGINLETGQWDGNGSIAQIWYIKNRDEFILKTEGDLGKEYAGEICYMLPIDLFGYVGKKKSENQYLKIRHADGLCWIHTGDIGYIREDKNLVIIDRIKRVFLRRGFKIYPAALENEAMSSGFLKECLVIERKSESYTEVNVPVMYAVLTENTEAQRKGFEEFCYQRFKKRSSIYQVIYTDEIPKTGAGKRAFKYIKQYDEKTFALAHGTREESRFVSREDILN